MEVPPFLAALDERVLVCDGAMGTQLYAKGVFINRCFESLNLSHEDLVFGVHVEYVRAGADVIETNTFGANRIKLRAFGLSEKVAAINFEGARIARRAAQRGSAGRGGPSNASPVYVAGAMGPLGVRIEPWGKTGVDEAEQLFREQAEALVQGGVDVFMLETFRDLNEIGAAIAAVRQVCDLPIVAQMTTEEDGNSLDGTPPEQFGPALVSRGASVVGINCSVGPAPMLESIERLASATDAWLSALPNAGKPRDIEGRNIYLCSPDYMASYARRFVHAGVRLVGGCCGTTPEHIRQISVAVRRAEPERPRISVAATTAANTPHAQPPVARAAKSPLAAALAGGRFVAGIELVPPRGHGFDAVIEDAKRLTRRHIDVVTIVDGPRSGARMSALSLAVLLAERTGIETLLQYSCRDKNLLGIQSDLLGAHAMGLRNLLGITGDVRALGDIPDATAVFDVDSVGLTNLLTRLNHGLDIGGQPIGPPTAFHVGVMVNPAADDLDAELRRFHYKLEAGAEFAVTRPVFDLATMERFLTRLGPVSVPIVAGIWPFESVAKAEFMANEVPGVSVPDRVLDRLRGARSDDGAAAEGVAIARELVGVLAPMVAGVHVSAPTGRLDLALGALDGLR